MLGSTDGFSVGNGGYNLFPDKTNLHMSEGSKD